MSHIFTRNKVLTHMGLTVDYDLHKRAKIRAIECGLSLSKYIEELIRKDLEKTEKE